MKPVSLSRLSRRSLLAGLLVVPLGLSACSGDEEYVPDPEALQIYSSQHKEITEAWAEAFTEETGVETQVRRGQDSSMGHMIVEEGDASPADVFLTENSPAMTVVERAGLLVARGRRPSRRRRSGVAGRRTP